MSWTDFYLVCLIVGLALSALSLVMGSLHLHLPGHWHFHFGHTHAAHGRGGGSHDFSVANVSSLMMFLAWFGGMGVILRAGLHASPFFAFLGALPFGFFGGWVVVLFVRRVMLANDHTLRPDDYILTGTVGTLTLAIREGGTGEITYTQGGSRKTLAARTENGQPLALGTEVVVLRFEHGIAFVRLFDETHVD
jgi:hypothetical protein